MCAAYPYHVAAEDVAELIASDAGDPDYLVSNPPPQICAHSRFDRTPVGSSLIASVWLFTTLCT